MTTAEVPRPWPAFGSGLALVILVGALATGCGESGSKDRTTAGTQDTARFGPASPSPQATPPEELCARIVAHWSRKALDGETYGDYQSMGLSTGQYEIVRKIVDAARFEQERAGAQAAERLIDRRAREDCDNRYRDGAPTGGPWQ